MRHKTLKEAQQALANTLDHLEQIRMTRSDDPELFSLKEDIRQLIPPAEPEEDEAARSRLAEL